jgi:hypothetical protein
MPQLLHHLRVDKKTTMIPSQVLQQQQVPEAVGANNVMFLNSSNEDIDWGTVDVYTCSASCDASKESSCTYLEECVVIQAPPKCESMPLKPELPPNMATINEEEPTA